MYKNEKVGNFFAHLILIISSFIILFPIIWTLRTSFATEAIAYSIPPQFLFKPTFENYINLFKENNLGIFFLRSLIVAGSSTVITIPIASLGSYAISKYRTGGESLKFFILLMQMLPPVVLVIPLFVIFNYLKLTNTLIGLIISYLAFNLPFIIWMLIGFFDEIPKELEESALIDGATRFKAFWKIIFPIAAPGIMAASIFSFILCWNEFLFALILTGPRSGTLPLALASLQTQRGVLIGKLSAGVMISIIPMIILAILMRKYLVRGLSFGAIKG